MPSRPPIARRTLAALALLAALGSTAQAGPIADWLASRTAPAGMNSGTDGSTDKSLFSRWLNGGATPFSSGKYDGNVIVGDKAWQRTKSAPDPVSEAEFKAAKKLFDQGDFRNAERLLRPLAKREVKKVTPWGEKAQYWLAEAQFRQKKFVDAEASFDLLCKKYNGSDYTEKAVARQFETANLWLASEDPKAKPMDWKSRFDGRQPLLDTGGYAVKALDHVRVNDTDGPLADDAALRTADHFHNIGDFESAAVYYDQLIAEHPKSDYKERALRSSIDSKMKAYIGPEYDITGLEQARETIRKTLTEFPDHAETAKDLYHSIDLIRDQEAERAYITGKYYVRARKPISAEYYFGLVIAKWPESKWAKLARNDMDAVAKMPRKASLPSKIMTAPGAADPSTMGGNGGNNGQPGGALNGLMNNMGGGGMGAGGAGMGSAPY